MKIIYIIILFISAIILLSFVYLFRKPGSPNLRTISINNHRILVETADTDKIRETGLSDRSSLPVDQGMLFIFPEIGIYNFWMKDMNFPLDFIWINGDLIVDLTQNVLPSENKDLFSLPIYASKYPCDKVLEINAGGIQSYSIKLGDRVQL